MRSPPRSPSADGRRSARRGTSPRSGVGADHGRRERPGEQLARQCGDLSPVDGVDAGQRSARRSGSRRRSSSPLPIRDIRELVSSRPSTRPPRSWPLARATSASVRPFAATSSSTSRTTPATSPSLLRLAARVHGQVPGVRVARHRRIHLVREATPLPDLLEQPRAHAAAQRRVEHAQREPAVVVPVERAHAQHEVRLLGVVGVQHQLGSARIRARPAARGATGVAVAAEPVLQSLAGQPEHLRRGRCCPPPRAPSAAACSGACRSRAARRGSSPSMDSSVPSTGRPSGWSPISAVQNASCSRSSGSSSRMAISSSTTLRSISMSRSVQQRVEHDVA